MPSDKIKILIVDDDAEMRSTLQRLLSRYSVTTASEGAAAVRLAETERPRLALLDINMPGMSGLQVLEKLNRFQPKPIVVMLTAEIGLETAVKALSLGAYAYLTKPFDSVRVTETVETALAEYARRNPL
jgi:DNA-binding NtrC family response regulator